MVRKHRAARAGQDRRGGTNFVGMDIPKARKSVDYSRIDLPVGFAFCPVCSTPVAVKVDGRTLHAHGGRRPETKCLGSGATLPVYVEPAKTTKMVTGPRAVVCPTCHVPATVPCVTQDGTRTAPHPRRKALHRLLGEPATLREGNVEEVPRTGRLREAIKSTKPQVVRPKDIECPECKASPKEGCVSTSTGKPVSNVHTARVRIATRRTNEARGL